MPFLPPVTTHPPAVHRRWCVTEHEVGETCVSGTVTIPDLPFHVWAKQKHGQTDTIEIIIDGGPTGTIVVEVPTDGTI